jgi:hypothetical protein
MRLLSLALLICGCGGSDGFDRAVPSRALLTIHVPGTGDTASASSLNQALLGETATFYTATVNASTSFNGGIGGFLANIEHIMASPPSQRSATHATWGPTNDALSKANYKFDVEKVDDNSFGYLFSAKLKTDNNWVGIVQGATHYTGDVAHAVGDFEVDYDTARQFDDNTSEESRIHVHFDSTTGPRQLAIAFNKAGVDNAMYHYGEKTDGSGELQFVALGDVNNDGVLETQGIFSRWLPTGQGRADVAVEGGSLPAPFGMSECWDSSFGRTFYQEGGHLVEGDPNTCAFQN